MTEARSRSCPTCRSIGRPDKDCQDPWHTFTPTLDAFAWIGQNLRDATVNLFPRPPSMIDLINQRMSPTLAELADQAKMTATKTNALRSQVGGSHYRDMAIQPVEYILKNNIPWAEGTAIKYLSRWRSKGGTEDLRKAIHIIELLIEHEEEVR